jgi:hypothetical protein
MPQSTDLGCQVSRRYYGESLRAGNKVGKTVVRIDDDDGRRERMKPLASLIHTATWNAEEEQGKHQRFRFGGRRLRAFHIYG